MKTLDELKIELKFDSTRFTAAIIKTIHPEWSMAEIFEKLNHPKEVKKLIAELREIPNGSIDEIEGDLL